MNGHTVMIMLDKMDGHLVLRGDQHMTQISTMLAMAAAEDPTIPDEGPVRELLHELGNALGYDPERAAVIVVRP